MLKNYIKIAIKVLLRRKLFTIISLFAISFTLSIVMAVTAFFDNILGNLPPEVNSSRTLGANHFRIIYEEGGFSAGMPGYTFINKYVKTLPNIEKITIYSIPLPVTAYAGNRKADIYRKRADGEFWKILDFKFYEGGPYTNEDEQNANFVCVINQATKDKFFPETSAVGKYIEINSQKYRIKGVVENTPLVRIVPFADIYVPISTSRNKNYLNQQILGSYMALILAEKKSDIPKIKSEFQHRIKNIDLPPPFENRRLVGNLETVFESISRLLSPTGEEPKTNLFISILILFMILFMILPAINLINLNAGRIMERISEIGIRKAFGATSRKLIGQFIVENIILTFIGGLLGFVLSHFILQIINNSGIIPYANFQLNIRVFFYGIIAILFFGIFSGVLPAWRMSKLHPVESLRGDVQ